MTLKSNVKEILSVEENKIKLCYLTSTSYSTIHRWLRDNHEKLTMKKVMEAMAEISGVKEKDLFESESKTAIVDTI